MKRERRLVLDAAIAGGIAFAAYAAMAARDIAFGDGPELTAAAIRNSVAHPPGYPLWIAIGHLASLLPLGPLPFRVNLTAAFYHALAIAIVYLTAYALARMRVAALFAAVLLGIGSPIFVSWSLQAEVFSLNDVFAAAIVLLCVRWLHEVRRWKTPIALGAIFGLGLSNQQTLILLAPAVLWTAWCARGGFPGRRAAVAIAAWSTLLLVLGFALPYAHTLLVSQHATGWQFGEARNVRELYGVIARTAYGGGLVAGAAEQGANAGARLLAMLAAMGWPAAFVAAGIAAIAAGRRFGELGIALSIVAFPLAAFCALANMDVGDAMLRAVFARFALLPLVALAPFAACFVGALQSLVRAVRPRIAATAALIAACTIVAALRLPALALTGEHAPRVLFTDIFNALAPHAILLTAGDPVDEAGEYFQSVENVRPDVTIVTYGLLNLPQYVRALSASIAVPPEVVYDFPPQTRRDMLVFANPQRPFYTVGERAIHAPGPKFQPYVTGIVSRMIPRGARPDVARRFRDEVRLESVSGYGAIPAERWQTNGFAGAVREYYAGGFFSTGFDAERLGRIAAARYWYDRAQRYFPDPMIERQIRALAPLSVR